MKKLVRNPDNAAMCHSWKALAVVIIFLLMAFSAFACEPEEQAKIYRKGAVESIKYCITKGSIGNGDVKVICVRGGQL